IGSTNTNLVLLAANTYTGNTIINTGKVTDGGGNAGLGANTTGGVVADRIQIAGGATLGFTAAAALDVNKGIRLLSGTPVVDVGNLNPTVGTARITGSSGTVKTLTLTTVPNRTWIGEITANVKLKKTGAGILTLSGTNNTYAGGTTIGDNTTAAEIDAVTMGANPGALDGT